MAPQAVGWQGRYSNRALFPSFCASGDYMMIVETVGRGAYEGIEAFIFSADVYKLTGEGAGSQPAFLSDIQARLAGTGGWKLPLDKNITEGVSLEEAHYQY